MDTKAAFEKWFRSKHDGQMITKGSGYSEPITQLMWQAWTASRAAIEIELPEKMLEVVADTLIHGRVMANDMLRNCTTAITSHGIRIKGRTV